MKRLLNAMGGLLGLLVVGTLAAAIVLTLEGRVYKPETERLVLQSPIERILESPISPVRETPRVEQPGPNPVPTRTPVPDRGVRVGPATEIVLSGGDMVIEDLRGLQVEGDTLYAYAQTPEGGGIVTVDLATGNVAPLFFPRPVQNVQAFHGSEDYAAWIEPAPDMGEYAKRIRALDRARGRTFTVAEGHPSNMRLRDGILVWRQSRDDTLGIYGYDLQAGQAFTVAEGLQGLLALPYVCSREWIIHIQSDPAQDDPRDYFHVRGDLYAHSLRTGSEVFVGKATFLTKALFEEQPPCDGNLVAWFSEKSEQYTAEEIDEGGRTHTYTYAVSVYEQHLTDLSARTDRVLDLGIKRLPDNIWLDGDILISSIAYDLKREVHFGLAGTFPYDQRIGGQMLLSDERLLLLSGTGYPPSHTRPQRLFTASIVRDPIR